MSLRRVMRWGGMVFVLPGLVVLGFVLLMPPPDPAQLRKTDVIVILGGSMYDDGRLGLETKARVKRGVELWKAGLAPRLHLTGGGMNNLGRSSGMAMAVFARTLGVPKEAISVETRSRSTLQNALFSRPHLAGAQSLRLVTDAFHLPRAWASFQAMGYHDLALSRANALVPKGIPAAHAAKVLLREWLAWWFNAARFAVWALADTLGLSTKEQRDAWLT